MKRKNIYVGEIFQQDLISFQCIRKILFVFDEEERRGIDLMNEGFSYPLISDKKGMIHIGQVFSLNQELADLGYPEELTNEDINKLLNEDFYNAVIKSKIYHNLQHIIGENIFSMEFYKNNIDFVKNGFKVQDVEIKEKPKSFIKKMLQKKEK